MDIDPTLSLPRTLQMPLGTEILLSTRCMASAGMPLRIAAAKGVRVKLGQLPAEDPATSALALGGFAVMVLQLIAQDIGPGHVDITWSRPWEDDSPDSSSKAPSHRIDVHVHPAHADVPSVSSQVEQQLCAAPEPSKQEVQAFLDAVDGKRPYGARKFQAAKAVLDEISRTIAMRQALACTRALPAPALSEIVSDHGVVLLSQMGFDRFNLPRALSAFIAGRMPS